MKLYSHPASPFARKVRVVAHEVGVKLEIVDINPRAHEALRRINPLGKIPTLVLDDGSALFDSPVICEYLNDAGSGKFFPGGGILRSNAGRWRSQGLHALADGICDAAVACSGERRLPEDRRNAETIARHIAAIHSGLDALERMCAKFPETPTIGEIATGCTLGYIDFRLGDLAWRATRPNLRAWYETFAKYDSMVATVPKDLS